MKIHIPKFEPMLKANEHLAHEAFEIDLGENVVEVVRCRDCLWANTNLFAKELGIVYCNNYGKRKKQDDFCSEGERRG